MQNSAVKQVASSKTEAPGRLHHLRIKKQDALYIMADVNMRSMRSMVKVLNMLGDLVGKRR